WSAAGSPVWPAWPGWPGATATCGATSTPAAESSRQIDGHTAGARHIRKLPPYDRHFRDGLPTSRPAQPIRVLPRGPVHRCVVVSATHRPVAVVLRRHKTTEHRGFFG